MAKKVVNSFNAGELSPYLYAREDVDKYQAGCQELENFIPLPYGGVTRRPPINYVANTKDDGDARLYPFTFNVDEAYMLEIGNSGLDDTGYIRFYRNGQQVITQGAVLNGGESTGYKWIRGKNYQGNLSPYYYLVAWDGSNASDPNMSNVTSLIVNGERVNALETSGSGENNFYITDFDELGFETIYFKVNFNGGVGTNPMSASNLTIALDGGTFEVPHSYTKQEVQDLKFTQSADVLFICSGNHPVRTLSRLSATDDTSWEMSDYDFDTGYPPLKEPNIDRDIKITNTDTNGFTTLTSNIDVFSADHVGAYWAFETLRDSSNQSVSAYYDSTQTSPSINASNAHWNISTNGIWLGKVTIQRSTDGQQTWDDYIVVGDTSDSGQTADSAKNAKNFSTNSSDKEPNNAYLRVRFDHRDNADDNPFNFSLVIEDQYVKALVKITTFIDAKNVEALVLSPFQDKISDYTEHTANIKYQDGRKIVITSSITPVDYGGTGSSNFTLSSAENPYAYTVTDLDTKILGCASGTVTSLAWDVSAVSFVSAGVIQVTTSEDHRIAKGMNITLNGVTTADGSLPDVNKSLQVTQVDSNTQFRLEVPNSTDETGTYSVSSTAQATAINMHYMFVVSGTGYTDGKLYQFFISPYDQTVTLLYQRTLTETDEKCVDIAFKGNAIFGIYQKQDASRMTVRMFDITKSAITFNTSKVFHRNDNSKGNFFSYKYYPRAIGFTTNGNYFFIHFFSQERYTTTRRERRRSGRGYRWFTITDEHFVNNNKLARLTSNFSQSALKQYGTSQSEPFWSDINMFQQGGNDLLWAIDSTAKNLQGLSVQTPFASTVGFDISGLFDEPTALHTQKDSDYDFVFYIAGRGSGTGGGVLTRYNFTGLNTYYECVKDVDDSNKDSFADQLSDGCWIQRYPNTHKWTEGAFSAKAGFPSCLAIYQNRMCFSGVAEEPDTVWLSSSDDYNNFNLGTLDTDALKLTINSGQLDNIKWLVPTTSLVIGTSGSEWVLEPESDRLPITPTSFSISRKSTYGSNNTQGTLVNSAVIFAMRQGRKVREWIFNQESQDFLAPDLTIFSEHITEGGIKTWAYQQQPDNCLWLVRNDGQLIGFTYEREQKVYGWHRHTVDNVNGNAVGFLSVSVLPSPQDEDQVWVIVDSNIPQTTSVTRNDTTVNDDNTVNTDVTPSSGKFIGYFSNREFENYKTYKGSDFCYEFTNPTTEEGENEILLTGLDRFEQKLVDVNADGVPLEQQTVVGGQIRIPEALYQKVYVGLPYTSTLAPMYLDVEEAGSTTLGSTKNAQYSTIRFKDTYQAKAGQTKTTLEQVAFDPDTTPLYSEDAKVWFNNASEYLKLVYVQNDTPTPCSVLAMITDIEEGG